MLIFFTIFGGPHDGDKFSLGMPMDCIHLNERPLEPSCTISPDYSSARLKTVRYEKRRLFVQKYGNVFFKDVYAFEDYDFREALREFRRFFNSVYKK